MAEFVTGDVWRSPPGVAYKVVDVVPYSGSRIATLRQGVAGDGRALQRYANNTAGWTRISTLTNQLETDPVQVVNSIFGKDWGSGAATLYLGGAQIPMTPQEVVSVREWLKAISP